MTSTRWVCNMMYQSWVMEGLGEPFLRIFRVGPSRLWNAGFIGLLVLQILYVENVGVIKPHDGNDHRVPGFFYNRPAAFIPVFYASPPCGTTLDLFHADDFAAQTNKPALDERQCECPSRRSSLRSSNAGNEPAAGTGRGCSEKKETRGVRCP